MSHQIMSQKPNGRPKILFVEDDPSVVLTFQTGLEAEGYSVDAVNSTSDALTRLANENYPIVITDIYLDERTGLDVLRASQDYNPGSAVIMITGQGTMETVMEATERGAFDYIAPAYTVVSASPKMLGWRSSRLVQVTRAADVGVRRRSVLSSETEEGLEGCYWGLAAVVSKHELIEVNLKLSAAHAVVRSGQPLLQVANGTIRQRHHRLGAFPQVSPVRLRTRDVFVAGLFEGGKGLQTVCVDGRAGNNVLGKKPVDRHLLEVWNNGHANAPGALPAFLNSDHHKGRTAPLQLPAASQTCLRAANPGVIDLYFSVQGLASCVHHGPSQFVQHHPGGFVARQAELTLQ